MSASQLRQVVGLLGPLFEVKRTYSSRAKNDAIDPSLPILNVGCPVANGSKADAPRHKSETTLMTPTGNVAPITILLSSACG